MLEASEAALGLTLTRGEQPQVIFLDLMMPTISGTEVLAILKGDPLTAHIAVFVVTTKAMDKRERSDIPRHAVAILSKAELPQKSLLAVLEKMRAQAESKIKEV